MFLTGLTSPIQLQPWSKSPVNIFTVSQLRDSIYPRAICQLITFSTKGTQYQIGEGANGSKEREEEEIYMHLYKRMAIPTNKKKLESTHRGCVTLLCTLDVIMPLVLYIVKIVFPEVWWGWILYLALLKSTWPILIILNNHPLIILKSLTCYWWPLRPWFTDMFIWVIAYFYVNNQRLIHFYLDVIILKFNLRSQLHN